MDQRTKQIQDAYGKNLEAFISRSKHISMIPQINRFLRYVPGTRVLDLGCSYGRDDTIFQQMGIDICGIDVAKEALQEAQRRNPKAKYLSGDARKIPFKDSTFDGVYANAVFIYLTSIEAYQTLAEIQRVLKPKGALYLATKEGKGKIKKRVAGQDLIQNLFTHRELQGLLRETNFKVLEVFREENRQDLDIPWIQFYCRKA